MNKGLHRRTNLLRKSSRRMWAKTCTKNNFSGPSYLWNQALGLVPSTDPRFESKCQAAALQFFSSLPQSHRFEDFAVQLQTVTLKPLRIRLLAQFRNDVAAGLWGDPDLALPYTISLLKRSPNNFELQEITENLVILKPIYDPKETLMVSPEKLIWWEDLFSLIPCVAIDQFTFHYCSYAFSLIRRFRMDIFGKTLSVGNFMKLKRLIPEERMVLLYILRLEHVNEVEETMALALAKALEYLDLVLDQIQRVNTLIRTRQAEIRNLEAVKQAAAVFIDSFTTLPLQNCAIPTELRELLELPDQSEQAAWLSRMLPDISSSQLALPMPLADFLLSTKPLYALPEREQMAYFQRELLRLSFPPFLLLIEMSQETIEEKSRMLAAWQLYHSLPFPDYMREVCYETMGGLVAVFTHDMRDTQLRFEFNYIRERAARFQSEAELRSSIAAFMQNSTQTVYVLDCFLDSPVDLETGKRAMEEAIGQASFTAKVLCLLLRIPPNSSSPTGSWQRRWKLASFESLTEPFSSSLEWLQTWLKRDTRSCLLSSDFVRSPARVETILTAAYPPIYENCSGEISDLVRNEEFCSLIGERLGIEEHNSEDWKGKVLSQPQESCLQDTVEKVLIAEAAALLRPVISTVKSLQAVPSFLFPESPLISKLWKATFLHLVPAASPAYPALPLQYPFVQLDYDCLITPEAPPAFQDVSITTLHMWVDPASVSLLQLYLNDIATLDLRAAPYESQGKALFQRFCADSKSFEELFTRYRAYRRAVLSLCNSEIQPLLTSFFTSNFHSLTKEELYKRLEDCEEQLTLAKDPTMRLYAVEDRTLHIFNSLHKRLSKTSLSSSLGIKHPTLTLLDPGRLFVCGGQTSSWFVESISAQSWIIMLPDVVKLQGNMRIERCYHGLARWKGFVYAIGGHVGRMLLRTCEKFSESTGKWQSLVQVLEAGRGYFTPLVYLDAIYVLGGRSPLIEVIHPDSDTITSLSLSLTVSSASTALITGEGKALVISEHVTCSVDLGLLQCWETAGTGVHMWSAYPPVLHGRDVFFVDEKLGFKCWSIDGGGIRLFN